MQKWIPECDRQVLDGVLMVMPHAKSDWVWHLEEARTCVREIIRSIVVDTPCLVLIDPEESIDLLEELAHHPLVHPRFIRSNDTWARDFAPLSVRDHEGMMLLDFRFNGWGLKYQHDWDDKISTALKETFNVPLLRQDMVLEGGSIESNGDILITTTACLLHEHRNPHLSQQEIENRLKNICGVKQIFWIEHGYLSGDDTDSHIDNLVRFLDRETIVYVCCDDRSDEHYEELNLMKQQIEAFEAYDHRIFKKVALPMCEPMYFEGERLPASYANFLILENRILMPTYGSPKDKEALKILAEHTTREVIGVDCRVLVRQHGSLHCMSMQFPQGTLKLS